MSLRRYLLLPIFGSVVITGSMAGAENWPEWRGPTELGISADTQFPMHWSSTENVRWKVNLPDRGNSTPIVWGDRVFVTQAVEKEHRRTLMCFARANGKLLWQSRVVYAEPEPTNAENPYCSGSPVTDGERVIAYCGSAGLHCYNFEGNELWGRDVGKVDSWQGSGSSPVIYKELCILNAGPGSQAMLIACDKRTGQVIWSVRPPRVGGGAAPGAPPPAGGGFDNAIRNADLSGAGGFLGSWATPVVASVDGHDELIVVHPLQVSAYEPLTGKEIWMCKGMPDQAFASPAIGEGIVICTGHRMAGGGTRINAIKLGGSGDVTATHHLWEVEFPKECVGSPVIFEGHIYLVTQFGSMLCLDLRSGKKVYEKRLESQGALGGSWSSPVLAGERLLVPNHSGEVFIVRAGAKFELLASNWVGEESSCASLAVSDGQIFLRTYKALWCFESRN